MGIYIFKSLLKITTMQGNGQGLLDPPKRKRPRMKRISAASVFTVESFSDLRKIEIDEALLRAWGNYDIPWGLPGSIAYIEARGFSADGSTIWDWAG